MPIFPDTGSNQALTMAAVTPPCALPNGVSSSGLTVAVQ